MSLPKSLSLLVVCGALLSLPLATGCGGSEFNGGPAPSAGAAGAALGGKDIECKEDADCSSEGCGRCDNGTCRYGCDAGQVCCNNGCQGCCTAADCYDGIGCTDNFCVEGTCKFTPNNKPCPTLQKCLVAKRGCALLQRDDSARRRASATTAQNRRRSRE